MAADATIDPASRGTQASTWVLRKPKNVATPTTLPATARRAHRLTLSPTMSTFAEATGTGGSIKGRLAGRRAALSLSKGGRVVRLKPDATSITAEGRASSG